MLKTFSTFFVILGSLMHLFCCGLPLLLSITSLATTLGFSSLSIFEFEWFEPIENYVLIVMGIMLAATYLVNRSSKQIDCTEDGLCEHPPCDEKKDISGYLLKIAVVLYLVNILTVILNKIGV